MTPEELGKPSVPISYVLLTLQLAAERGVTRDAMLAGLELPPGLLEQPDARLGLLQYGRLCLRALQLTREAALGYEFGLRNNLTTHGFYGFGVMSQMNVRESLEFAARFAALRMPGWTLRFFVEGSHGVLEAREAVPFGRLRQYALDMMLISLYNSHHQFLPATGKVDLWFDCAEPEHYARYRDRLPSVRFSAGANQIRLPAALLEHPIATANAVTARLVTRECERELALLGYTQDIVERVRAVLVNDRGRYPDLSAAASRLFMTSRTFKRRLYAHGMTFQQLLDAARRRDCMRLLDDSTLTLDEVAARLGYSSSANFSRAFRKWTGTTPGAFRVRPAVSRRTG